MSIRTIRTAAGPRIWIATIMAIAAIATSVTTVGAAAMSDEQTYGKELSAAQTIRIADLLERPEQYLDQQVKVEGLVEDICPMKGCWIDILERSSKQTMRFKVEDDVIVFPAEAKGGQVIAEGILRRHEMSQEQARRHLRHLAAEKGEPFDESTVTGPMTFFQIEGLGAKVTGH